MLIADCFHAKRFYFNINSITRINQYRTFIMLKIFVTILVLYLLYVALLFCFQRSLLFPGQYIKPPNILIENNDYIQQVWLETSFGKVEAWFSRANRVENIRNTSLILAHGNYELIDYCIEELLMYKELGIHVLLVEFPGYGRSEGSPSQKTVTETFVKAYDWLIENCGMDENSIIVHGRSVGGGAVCALANERKVKAIILQSTFTNVTQFTNRYLVPGFLVKDIFDNLSVVKSFTGPILIFHGKYDEVIPFQNGKQLYENSKNAQFIAYNCNHNDFPPNRDIYWDTIRIFLDRILEDSLSKN
jgi:fermentation-respiration switch protein FrsA (DUF1100 family)